MFKNNQYTLLILISILFGIFGGILGILVTEEYIIEKAFRIPFIGEINLSENTSGSNVIIREAKNVVVEQNTKVSESTKTVKGSILGVFKKNIANSSNAIVNKNLNLTEYYNLNNFIAQGFVITSDGWLVTNLSDDRLVPNKKTGVIATTTLAEIANDYVVVDNNKHIYEIKSVVKKNDFDYVFIEINAKDLPVRAFADVDNMKNGELIIGTSWLGGTFVSSVYDIFDVEENVKDSDVYLKSMKLNNAINNYPGLFLFDLNGNLVGLTDEKGKIQLNDKLIVFSKDFLPEMAKDNASLGVYYQNLFLLFDENSSLGNGALISKNKDGISVKKDSSASDAGLKEGDIILSINNQEINEENDLNKIISLYKSGDKVKLSYKRGEITEAIMIELD